MFPQKMAFESKFCAGNKIALVAFTWFVKLFTAFIKHHKRISMQIYMETRDVVSNLDTKELRDSMGREVSLMVETRKDALANLDTKELRESLKREVILMVETTKEALANEAEIVFL